MHPVAWGMHIALRLWGGCRVGLGVEVARSHGHLWKGCWRKAGLRGQRTFWEAVPDTADNMI